MPNLVLEFEKKREDTSPAIKCLTDKFAQSTTASSSVPIVADSKERKTETETQAMKHLGFTTIMWEQMF
jgi:hypothetical protein